MNEHVTLEESIRKEADKTIQDISDKTAAAIKKLDETYASEVEKFRKDKEIESRVKTAMELAKISSRAMLERRKLKLIFIESFISRIVNEAVKTITCDPRYRRFLVDTINETIDHTEDKADLFLGHEDMAHQKEIADTININRRNDITTKEDKAIKWGGCIIQDMKGRIFNSTIERIHFRRSSSIRQEAVNILKQNGYY